MTQATNKEDDQWLDALAGQSDPSASPKINRQAEALRRALAARKDLLDAQVPEADARQYEQILFRLRQEGLTGSHRMWSSPVVWGMVATVVLGVGVVVQMAGLDPGQDDANVMRGGQSTVLIVEFPEVRLAELLDGLKSAGESPSVKKESVGSIVLIVKGTDRVLDYLAAQQIVPTSENGFVTIELRPVKHKQ